MYIYVIGHIYWFAYVEPKLDPGMKPTGYDVFNFFCLFIFILRLKALCVRVVCLHVCICIMCVWHLWRTEFVIRPFGTRVRQLSAAMCVLGSKSLSSAGKCSEWRGHFSSPASVFLDFVKSSCVSVHQGSWAVVFFFVVFLSGLGVSNAGFIEFGGVSSCPVL